MQNLITAPGKYLTPAAIDTLRKGIKKEFKVDERTGRGRYTFDSIEALKSYKISLTSIPEIQKFSTGMDSSLQGTVTTPSVNPLIQQTQNFLPGLIQILTAKRTADEVIGMYLTGQWSDSQIVKADIEMTGYPTNYDDYSNIPQASDNTNWNVRTNVLFTIGMTVGMLETARAARMNQNPSVWKRNACAYSLEVIRNTTAYFGFNNGANLTYGILTDPNLAAYQQAPQNAAMNTLFADSAYLEIVNVFITAIQNLVTGAAGNIDARKTPLVLAIATDVEVYLNQTTDFGSQVTIKSYLESLYPLIKIVSVPQFNSAYTSQNVFYLFADVIDDDSTDDHRTWLQPITTRFQDLGLMQDVQNYKQGFVMGTCGAFLQRPWAVVRYYGV